MNVEIPTNQVDIVEDSKAGDTSHIMKPIYPDPDKKVRDNAKEMQEENSRLTFAKYEEVYGVPVTYGDYSLESALNGVIK